MTCDVQSVPPAPRRVRWGAALQRRWPLVAIGFGMTVYGGLLSLMLFYAASGKARDDALLEQGVVATAKATIEEIVTPPKEATYVDGRPAEQIDYVFETEDGSRVKGRAYAGRGDFHEIQSPTVHYLPHQPQINRLAGSRLCLLPDLVTPVVNLVVLPGIGVLLFWLLGALRLRRVLSRGDVAVAEPVTIRKVRWVVPMMFRVDYRFRDHGARWQDGHHWVRAHSTLGERLASVPGRLAVVHDRARPQVSRLVIPEDFGADARVPQQQTAPRP